MLRTNLHGLQSFYSKMIQNDENTCEGCVHLKNRKCNIYSAMENMIRCIEYSAMELTKWQNQDTR